ncbi:8817_t:CDS:1 [Paraglomus brasilianum]|uniref:8817_t:CDS:1 n=1 Tax=Paraglomus brasilianum TaxID=144538 RepID=A0A9N9GT22_9GLOM|nr:8817_t:CDS:1 [Paraglomus brasilianum]
MSELNNMNNDSVRCYNNVCQLSYSDDFNFDDTNTIQMPIDLLVSSHTQDFHPPVISFPLPNNVDITSPTMNTVDYGNTGYSTSYQDNPSDSYYYTHPSNVDTMDGQLNIPCPPARYDHVEIPANGSWPLPGSFQRLHGSSVQYPDTTTPGLTNNYLQHLGTIDNTSIAYMLTQMPPPQTSLSSNVMNEPASTEYIVMKVEYTRISAADIDRILAVSRE